MHYCLPASKCHLMFEGQCFGILGALHWSKLLYSKIRSTIDGCGLCTNGSLPADDKPNKHRDPSYPSSHDAEALSFETTLATNLCLAL